MSADNIPTARGTIVSISAGAPATEDQSGYEAKTYTALGETLGYPGAGATFGVATRTPLATGRDVKSAGNKSFADLSIPMTAEGTDAGQVIALAHAPEGANEGEVVSIKVDRPASLDGVTRQVTYHCGFVTSFATGDAASDSFVDRTLALATNHTLDLAPA